MLQILRSQSCRSLLRYDLPLGSRCLLFPAAARISEVGLLGNSASGCSLSTEAQLDKPSLRSRSGVSSLDSSTAAEHSSQADTGGTQRYLHKTHSSCAGYAQTPRCSAGDASLQQSHVHHTSAVARKKEPRFVDKLRISAQAGKGGSGCVSFSVGRGAILASSQAVGRVLC